MTRAPRPKRAPLPPSLDQEEAGFQASVVKLAQVMGWLTYHTYDSRRSVEGFPDLTLLHAASGTLLFRELKRERGKVTPAQSRWLVAFADAHQDAAVWRPSDWPEIEATLTGVRR